MKCAAEKPRRCCITAGRDTEVLCGPGLVSPPSAWGNLWACLWRNTLWSGGLCARHGGRAATGSADTRLQWVFPCISVTIYTFVLLIAILAHKLSLVYEEEWQQSCVFGWEPLTRICYSGCSSWSSKLPLTDRGNSSQTGSSPSWCFCLAPSRALRWTGCRHSAS